MKLRIAIFGLSITSSWGNGHATTYRGLVRELARRGHQLWFYERDVEWYAAHRDLPEPPFCETILYDDLASVQRRHRQRVESADLVIIGSYVPDGVALGQWVTRAARGVTAFYDIDTPVTLAGLSQGAVGYLNRELIGRYRIYLSFTGGPLLRRLEAEYGAAMARPLYCAVDPQFYRPCRPAPEWDLGYMGTYCPDRQRKLNQLLFGPARQLAVRRFIVAGPQYPPQVRWPANVTHVAHVPPRQHPRFYGAQALTLNLTRAAMVQAGYAPSVRLFEAAACATPIVSDAWPGLESFFQPGQEILVARNGLEVIECLERLSPGQRQALGQAARERVLAEHTPRHRAIQLEQYYQEAAQPSRSNAVAELTGGRS